MFIPKATYKDKSSDITGLINELDSLLSQEWGDAFTYDIEEANRASVVKLLYAATRLPVPLKMTLSAQSFNNLEFGRRELQRKLKECLPESITDAQISKVKNLLRNSNRRAFKNVQKDYSNWLKETAEFLRLCYGTEVAEKWKNESLASDVKPNNEIHGLQIQINQKIEALQEL